MKKTTLSILLFILIIFISACGKDEYEPQAINPEVDICVVCKMAIKDDQYATQIVTKDGQSLKFDDVGDMNKWKQENGEDNIGATFVRDYHSLEWLPYEKAYYVYDSMIQTPMAYGIVSFEKEEDAESFITNHGTGKLMTAEQLSEHTWDVNHDMKDEMKNKHGHNHDDSNESSQHNNSSMDGVNESTHNMDSTHK